MEKGQKTWRFYVLFSNRTLHVVGLWSSVFFLLTKVLCVEFFSRELEYQLRGQRQFWYMRELIIYLQLWYDVLRYSNCLLSQTMFLKFLYNFIWLYFCKVIHSLHDSYSSLLKTCYKTVTDLSNKIKCNFFKIKISTNSNKNVLAENILASGFGDQSQSMTLYLACRF